MEYESSITENMDIWKIQSTLHESVKGIFHKKL